MIALVRGKIFDKFEDSLVVDVNGIGYEILLAQSDLDKLTKGEDVLLHTHMAVRENSQDLYGFIDASSKKLFLNLIKVNGVGPKVGLSILDIGEASEIASAISQGNIVYLKQANGVGKRGAEKIIVELRDKLEKSAVEVKVANNKYQDAYSALLTLGYSANQASEAIASLPSDLDSEAALREALKGLNQ